jgi:hypothetical protein
MVRTHQPGEAVFKAILPEDIDWKPFPAFPPSVRLAVLVGQPSERGPYVIRVKAPSGVKLMPHRHPEDRIYTVMSGVFYIGLAIGSTGTRSRPIRQAASSSCQAIHHISTGRSPASTSPRLRRSVHWVSSISIAEMTRASRVVRNARHKPKTASNAHPRRRCGITARLPTAI